MPQAFLDVSEVLLDPTLVDSFDVIRRLETVGTNGRSSFTPTTIKGVIGVVTMASPNDLMRFDDRDQMGRTLSVITKFRLQGVATAGGANYKPDVVVWRGDNYQVKEIEPYPQYGAGFVQAFVESVDSIDVAPSAM